MVFKKFEWKSKKRFFKRSVTNSYSFSFCFIKNNKNASFRNHTIIYNSSIYFYPLWISFHGNVLDNSNFTIIWQKPVSNAKCLHWMTNCCLFFRTYMSDFTRQLVYNLIFLRLKLIIHKIAFLGMYLLSNIMVLLWRNRAKIYLREDNYGRFLGGPTPFAS